MPCHLVVFEPQTRAKQTWICDEENTERLVGDDHAAEGAGEYSDVQGTRFSVDWTKSRLTGFTRYREDGEVVASGGADGSQTSIT